MTKKMTSVAELTQNEISTVSGGIERQYALSHPLYPLLPLSTKNMLILSGAIIALTAVVCDMTSAELALLAGILGGGIKCLEAGNPQSAVESGISKALLVASTFIIKKYAFDKK